MSLVRNEQTKLTATYLNGLAIALFAVGGLAPLFSYAFGSMGGRPLWTVILTAAICLVVSAILHLIAPHPQETHSVSNLEFILLFSIAPIGALLIAGFLLIVLRRTPR
jgi:hypothetical protein